MTTPATCRLRHFHSSCPCTVEDALEGSVLPLHLHSTCLSGFGVSVLASLRSQPSIGHVCMIASLLDVVASTMCWAQQRCINRKPTATHSKICTVSRVESMDLVIARITSTLRTTLGSRQHTHASCVFSISSQHAIKLWCPMPWFVCPCRLNADPTTWMDDGTWEGTMTDMLWDEDGELFKCNPRPAQWGPPAIVTGRKSVDTLLALKRYPCYV